MSFAVVASLYLHTDQPHFEENDMTANYTFYVFSRVLGTVRGEDV